MITDIIFALGALGTCLQDPGELVEKLRSDDIADRERAFYKLEELGDKAEAELKRAAADSDVAFGQQVRVLLGILDLDRTLSPALKKAVPGISRRVGLRGPGEALRIYLEISGKSADAGRRFLHPELRRSDLEPLAEMAVRAAGTPEEKIYACAAAGEWFHRSAEPAVLALLRDPDERVREAAVTALGQFRGRGAIPILLREYPEDSPWLLDALVSWESFNPFEAVPRFVPFIRHADPAVRRNAYRLLYRVDAYETVPGVMKILNEPDAPAKVEALGFLKDMGIRECGPTVLPLLADKDHGVRYAALHCLTDLGLPIPENQWRALLADSNQSVLGLAMIKVRNRGGPGLIPAIRKNLDHPDEDVKEWAIHALASLNDPQLSDTLVAFLSDPGCTIKRTVMAAVSTPGPSKASRLIQEILEDVHEKTGIREEALETLERLKVLPAPNRLLKLTRDGDVDIALEAACRLAATAPELIRPEIPRLLDNEAARQEYRMAYLLDHMKSPALVPLLLKAFEGPSDARRFVARALEAQNAVEAVPALRALLKHEDASLRKDAATLLGQLKASEARPDLLALLEDPEGQVRGAALGALDSVGFGADASPVRKMTCDPETYVRSAAVDVLRSHRVREAIPDLLRLLDDPEDRIYRYAAETLVELGDRDLIPKVLGWLDSGDSSRVALAVELLAVLRPPEAGPRIPAMLDHRDVSVRWRGARLAGVLGMKEHARGLMPHLKEHALGGDAVQALGSLEARELIPDLQALLGDPDVVARRNALNALTGLGAVEAAPRIRGLLSDPDCEIRGLAAESLGLLGDRESVSRMVELLKDPNPSLRLSAVSGLLAMGDRGSGPAMIPLVHDPLIGVRCAALEALGEWRTTEAVPELLRMARDPACRTRRSAINALGEIGSREAGPDLVRILDDDRYWSDAASALAKLQYTGAIPALRALVSRKDGSDSQDLAEALAELGDPSALEAQLKAGSVAAATYLCERGDPRGIPVLQDRQESWWGAAPTLLNAVRNPAGWKVLKDRRVKGRLEKSRASLFESVARAAGLEVRWEGGNTYEEMAWRISSDTVGWSLGSIDLVKALDDLVGRDRYGGCGRSRPPPWDYILEKDHIRVLPRAEAAKFWKAWWEAEQKK